MDGCTHSVRSFGTLIGAETSRSDPRMVANGTYIVTIACVRVPISFEAAPIRSRGQAGVLAKRRRERTRFAKTQIEADLRHRHRRIRQQGLGLLDAHAAQIAVRRQTE